MDGLISENASKKGEHLKKIKLESLIQLKLFFSICKNFIFHLYPKVARFFKNSFIWKKIILKGRGFRGGSDEKKGECGSDESLKDYGVNLL